MYGAAIALIWPLFIEEGGLFDHEQKRVAAFAEISSPQQLEHFQQMDELADNIIVNLLDWQVSLQDSFPQDLFFCTIL